MTSPLEKKIETIARKAREASPELANLSTNVKNRILGEIAEDLIRRRDEIRRANQKDLKAVGAYPKRGLLRCYNKPLLSAAMLDRLTLTDKRIGEMAQGLREVQALPDPVGQVVKSWKRPNGLEVQRVRIPLGVIGIIYESRPNVTADSASLCLKSGNVCILRGGSEAIHSNTAIVAVLSEAAQNFA